MKRQKAKSVKLAQNEIICSKCETILTIDEDIVSEEVIQCPECEKLISNPFFFSGKFVVCLYCGNNGEIPKALENTLVLGCPNCGNDIYNPHSADFNAINCPACQMQSHVSEDLFKERYLQCPTCGNDMIKNPYFKKAPLREIFKERAVHEDSPIIVEDKDQSFDNSKAEKNKNIIWIAVAISALIILITIGYISDQRTSYTSRSYERASTTTQQWYEGGSLHKAGISDWKIAADRNKLATCADIISTYRPNYTNQQLRVAANELKTCINSAIRDHTRFDNESVAAVAVICLTGLGYIN